MLINALNKITKRENLSETEASDLMHYLSTGEANSFQIAAFIAAISAKKETAEEITGLARGMREKSLKIKTDGFETIVDSCGTGGDSTGTFNISTASAIIAAASGLNVAKHSNFGFTSKCGSSNVLESLGIPLLKQAGEAEHSLRKNSIAFIHAPYFHNSTLYVNQVRKELGIRTIFNFLGPLTNPTSPTGQVIGVSDQKILPRMTQALKNLGCNKALVLCGVDPIMDEISICSKTLIYELNNGEITNYEITPEEFGLKRASIEEIQGGDPTHNAEIIENIFTGNLKGAKLEILLLNSAALLYVGSRVLSLKEGIKLAAEVIESGKAFEKLQQLRSNTYS